eukprot:TRINITY_DN460_c0_g1_i1.p1 TRINITY_DN460_c0_g1~~TRINITY_DN460_c0_g1_i1.p1  ORF type:complete len:104 (+),score=11.36 TRINITY_DN460_c0_g1_i1:93-404(+)
MAEAIVNSLIQSSKVFVFSKTYCGYCARVKALFDKLKIPYQIAELDTRGDGSEIQAYLGKLTGGTSVPRVFVGGKFIGGSDDTLALYNSGKLATILKEQGIDI